MKKRGESYITSRGSKCSRVRKHFCLLSIDPGPPLSQRGWFVRAPGALQMLDQCTALQRTLAEVSPELQNCGLLALTHRFSYCDQIPKSQLKGAAGVVLFILYFESGVSHSQAGFKLTEG